MSERFCCSAQCRSTRAAHQPAQEGAGTRGSWSPGSRAGLVGVGYVNGRAAELLCKGRGPINTFLDS